MTPDAPWQKFYKDIRSTLSYPEGSLCEAVFSTAEKYPDATAIIYKSGCVSFREMTQRIINLQSAFESIGIKPGDRVAVCLPNIPQAVYSLYALNRMGAVSCFLHPLSAAGEFAMYINESQCDFVIALDSLATVFEEVFKVTGEKTLIITSPADELNFIKRITYTFTKKRTASPKNKSIVLWNDLLKKSAGVADVVKRDKNKLAVILFSGGTTGAPKGVMLSDFNINAMAIQTLKMCNCKTVGASILAAMPMFHGFGLGVSVHTALVGGAACILIPRFNPKEYASLIKKYHPNFIVGVPTLFEALMRCKNLNNTDLSCLRGVFSGGDALSAELRQKFDDFLQEHRASVRIREGYGSTECVAVSCLTPYNTRRDGSVGIPVSDNFIKICKAGSDVEIACGEVGEICISGPSVMMGYLNDEEENKKVLKLHTDKRIWLHSGDLGYMDSDGFVYYKQRLKRLIISNGYNVYPSQVESVLNNYCGVKESCVTGIRDSYKMQRIKAYVVLNEEYSTDEITRKEILHYCRKHIARYAVPDELVFVSSLPRTKLGKIAYTELEAVSDN
ncbi:MAG: acyl--CoA ligase [Clostridia bacterium]|nr:acyl--CoA ligase [Clostridia bacterium]